MWSNRKDRLKSAKFVPSYDTPKFVLTNLVLMIENEEKGPL